MSFLTDAYLLFFPKICFCCHQILVKNEFIICLRCRLDLPLTQFTATSANKVEQIFYGRAQIEFATALLFYRNKGKTQQLIYHLKYKGHQQIGSFLGKWLGDELESSNRFGLVDMIIPVPLHQKKLKKRGYNQLTTFGQCLSIILKVPFVSEALICTTRIETQTLKRRFERWKNVDNLFQIANPEIIQNKHILLIDDVITTGATLEACVTALSKVASIKISIATMAYTE